MSERLNGTRRDVGYTEAHEAGYDTSISRMSKLFTRAGIKLVPPIAIANTVLTGLSGEEAGEEVTFFDTNPSAGSICDELPRLNSVDATSPNTLNNNTEKELAFREYFNVRAGLREEGIKSFPAGESPAVVEYRGRARYDLVKHGVELMQKYLNVGITFNHETQIVSLPEDGEFDLTNITDTILLEQYIYVAFITELNPRYMRNQLDDIKWLYAQDIPMKFEPDGPVLADHRGFLRLSRLYQVLTPLEFKPPQGIRFISSSEIDGKRGRYDGEADELLISERAVPGTPPHEEAHRQAATQQLIGSYDDFEARINSVREELIQQGHTLGEGSYVSSYAATKLIEDYAETFEAYVAYAHEFRAKILRLEQEGSPDAIVLRAKYDYMKEQFGGIEFMGIAEIFNPLRGEVYAIVDFEDGIPFLSCPGSEDGLTATYLSDKDEVIILEGITAGISGLVGVSVVNSEGEEISGYIDPFLLERRTGLTDGITD